MGLPLVGSLLAAGVLPRHAVPIELLLIPLPPVPLFTQLVGTFPNVLIDPLLVLDLVLQTLDLLLLALDFGLELEPVLFLLDLHFL